MPPLPNARHERFAQGLFEGMTADEAFVTAGYKQNRGNASRLKSNENVRARLAELQTETAASAKVTLERSWPTLWMPPQSPSRKAKGRLWSRPRWPRQSFSASTFNGSRLAATVTLTALNSTREIADKVLERLIEAFIPIDEADRQGLIDLYERHLKETEEYLASIRARPIIAERVDSRNLKTPWQSHRPYTPASPLRTGYKANGSKPA